MSEESIRTACPGCQAAVKVPSRAVGKRVRCPKCQQAFTVADPAESTAGSRRSTKGGSSGGFDDDLLAGLGEGAAQAETAEETQRREAATAAAKASVRVASAPTSSSPQPRAKTDWGPLVTTFFGCYFGRSIPNFFCVLTLVFGIVLTFAGCNEMKLRDESHAEPQTITCEQLATRGPGDNRHVIMTNFILLPNYVYESGLSGWKGAWIPVVSEEAMERQLAAELNVKVAEIATKSDADREAAVNRIRPSDFHFRVIVSFPKADGAAYVERISGETTLQGSLFEEFARIGNDRQSLLREAYPNVDVGQCYILVVGREPASAATARLQAGGGIGLALVSLATAGIRAKRAAGA